VLLAAKVILVGNLVGVAVRDFVIRAISDTRIAVTIGRVSYVSIFVIGIIIGLQQVDVDISFLGNSIIVLLGVVLASIGITIGIGSQHHVANLVARQELANLSVGDRIKIQGHVGTIVEIRRTKVHLMTEEGTTYIPASMFSHEPYVLLSSDD
ncbi:MAG: mechanosensitive ion channel, partial [Gammaproteobacteria bacterium]|nr:mechanosensitive ion channel [Gammaproteobacteria bacterium]